MLAEYDAVTDPVVANEANTCWHDSPTNCGVKIPFQMLWPPFIMR
jgi:hypothetical protein